MHQRAGFNLQKKKQRNKRQRHYDVSTGISLSFRFFKGTADNSGDLAVQVVDR